MTLVRVSLTIPRVESWYSTLIAHVPPWGSSSDVYAWDAPRQ